MASSNNQTLVLVVLLLCLTERPARSASTGDEKESPAVGGALQQSSGDGAQPQAETSSQEDSQHRQSEHPSEGGADGTDPDPSSVQTGNVEQELRAVLQELKPLLSEECFHSAEHLLQNVSSSHLLDFFHRLKNSIRSNRDHHKLDEEESTSESESRGQQEVDSSSSVDYTLHTAAAAVAAVIYLLVRPTVKVKVNLKVTGQTFGADEALLSKVKRMGWSVTVETTRDLQDSHVVIVFCPITSRVGSDVEAAMTDVRDSCGQKPVILVLMHHTRDEDYSTAGRRWSDEYDNVVLDVHVLFHETKRGLLTCPKNDEAAAQILRELQRL